MQTLNAEINKALANKTVREHFLAQGAEPMPMTPNEPGAFIRSEIVKWTRAVEVSGAKVE